jgi:hypothetical protein
MLGRFLITVSLAALLGVAPAIAQGSKEEGTAPAQLLKKKKSIQPGKIATKNSADKKAVINFLRLPTSPSKLPRECSGSPLAERYDGPDGRTPARPC